MHDRPVRWSFIHRVMDNPIIAKELKGRMRGRQGFIIMTAYLALISLVIVSVYFYSTDNGNMSRSSPDALQELGRLVFTAVVMLEFLMLGFIGPALTLGAISSERERQTFDLLRASLLSSRALVLGKLGSTVTYLILLVLTALPLQSLAFFLGGVGMAEMVISLVMLIVTALLYCTLGLYFSSIAKRTITATVTTYSTLIFPVIIVAIAFFVLVQSSPDMSSASDETQRLVINSVWILLSTNPFTAGYVSELMLVEEQSLFLIYPPGFSLVLFSPWVIYVIFALTMTVLMIWLIVFYLNRYER
jgi:ABC-type transport system involved in multi-copper enzyme maturation permease subunit